MSQLYVPDGTWVLCTEGKKIPRISVASQSTIKLAGGKLAATEDDRFDGNFVCFKMVVAGALIGAIAAAAIAASGGAVLGVLAAGAAGAAVGASVGKLVSKLPSICSLLCKPSDWTQVHPQVKYEGKRALLKDATLSCLLGGTITLKMPDYQESIDMGLLGGADVYHNSHEETFGNDEKGKPNEALTDAEKDRIKEYHRLTADELKKLRLDPKQFDDNKASGFYAQLYRNEKTGKYVLAYRGTEGAVNDAMEDGTQGVGLSSKQYDQSVHLADNVQKQLRRQNVSDDQVIIAGHSLGGGLAAVAAAKTGYKTYTYNAAGVHDRTFSKNAIKRADTKNVQAYNADDDPLNGAQDNREKILGKMSYLGAILLLTGGLHRASGQRMEVETDANLLTGHTTIHIVHTLEKEMAAAGGLTVTAKDK